MTVPYRSALTLLAVPPLVRYGSETTQVRAERAAAVAVRLTPNTTRPGVRTNVKLTVAVTPSSVAKGRYVYLQRWTSSGWRTAKSARLNTYGRAYFYELRRSRVKETYRVRIYSRSGITGAYSDRVTVGWR